MQLRLTCLKGVQAVLRGSLNAYSWLSDVPKINFFGRRSTALHQADEGQQPETRCRKDASREGEFLKNVRIPNFRKNNAISEFVVENVVKLNPLSLNNVIYKISCNDCEQCYIGETGEVASADEEAARKYPEKLAKIIKDGGYCAHQIFNADETGLFWKKMPTCTYIAKFEKNASGFKAAKDRVTLLLCSNASGDRMLKPLLVNRSLKPRALKGKDLNTLPVHWMANKKAWVTTAIFTEWFNKCFVPEVENYMKEMGLEFKILLILDNAPGHPNLEHPNIKEIGGEGFDDFGEHDIEELLVDEALNDDDILESMVDTTKDFETVDSELEDVTPLDEKLLREGLQLSDPFPKDSRDPLKDYCQHLNLPTKMCTIGYEAMVRTERNLLLRSCLKYICYPCQITRCLVNKHSCIRYALNEAWKPQLWSMFCLCINYRYRLAYSFYSDCASGFMGYVRADSPLEDITLELMEQHIVQLPPKIQLDLRFETYRI
ncbi:hypothetical protein LAZ67_X004047 [Cordylochernes scorpioides]|uniref:DDE-1 domain-containing protein n=1 Tax=Cordylochernes scorpioides TaxID=51811 RepID=A0ABY6LX84_9ARAC|nr:hypothetical protein LAZ67_X004047 [Cordylochernes scorpioides]